MKCPKCHNSETAVIDSRDTEDGSAIRRRRTCEACGYRFTTFERARTLEIMVKKEDGRLQPYDREKLAKSIYIACGKLKIESKDVDKMITKIEEEIIGEEEIKTKKLGKLILKALKNFSDVAYIRYASVYKQFTDIETFKKELENLE